MCSSQTRMCLWVESKSSHFNYFCPPGFTLCVISMSQTPNYYFSLICPRVCRYWESIDLPEVADPLNAVNTHTNTHTRKQYIWFPAVVSTGFKTTNPFSPFRGSLRNWVSFPHCFLLLSCILVCLGLFSAREVNHCWQRKDHKSKTLEPLFVSDSRYPLDSVQPVL